MHVARSKTNPGRRRESNSERFTVQAGWVVNCTGPQDISGEQNLRWFKICSTAALFKRMS